MISIAQKFSRTVRKTRVHKPNLGHSPIVKPADSCGGGNRTFAIKVHQVGENRRSAELSEQSGDLAAVIGTVIGEVLQRLPQRILAGTELKGLVLENAIEIALRKAADVGEQLLALRLPVLAQRGDGLDFGVTGKRGMRAVMETLVPDPFAAADVDQRVAHGREAGTKRFGELLVRELGGSFERSVVGPGVVVEELAC